MHIIGVVPARLGSSRFPGKPLALIHGMPMIGDVYLRSAMAAIWGITGSSSAQLRRHFSGFGGVSVVRDSDTAGLHFNEVPETIVHPVVGLEVLAGHRVFTFNAGARADVRDDVVANGIDRQLHADFDFKHPIQGEWFTAISASGEAFGWGNNGALSQRDYVEIESSITAQRGSDLTLVWYMDYSSNPLVVSVGNLAERVYGAVEVQVKPADAWTIKAFYGS